MSGQAYVKVGGPPDTWRLLRVIGLDGIEIPDVIEANAAEGWLVRLKRDEAGKIISDGDELATERIECAFTIRGPA